MESVLNEPNIAQLTCLVCGKTVDAGWFAHIEEDGRWVYFCSPGCALKHFQKDVYSTATEPENAVPDWSDLNKYR